MCYNLSYHALVGNTFNVFNFNLYYLFIIAFKQWRFFFAERGYCLSNDYFDSIKGQLSVSYSVIGQVWMLFKVTIQMWSLATMYANLVNFGFIVGRRGLVGLFAYPRRQGSADRIPVVPLSFIRFQSVEKRRSSREKRKCTIWPAT